MTTRAPLPKARQVARKDTTEDLWVIKLEPETPFAFKPGQYCTIGSGGLERAYSIVSAPYEPLIELFVELVPEPEGNLTPILWKLKNNDEVSIRPRAKGIFTMEDKYPNQLMVATVTGIAPFLSMIRQYLHDEKSGHRFFVLQGASYYKEFTYQDEMEQLAQDHPDLISYVPTVSRPSAESNIGWHGAEGRVNLIVEEYIRRLGLDSESTLVYACGHPEMIEDVKTRLTPQGFKVKEERYWKE